MLKTIEQMTGKSISELFDWVVGTSTGGILALGMIYGEDYMNILLAQFAKSVYPAGYVVARLCVFCTCTRMSETVL